MNIFQLLFFTVWLYMTLAFFVATLRRDNGTADIVWGPGFLLIAVVTLFHTSAWTARAFLILLLVILWALRLAMHIFSRNMGKPEDRRYQNWRKQWGSWAVVRSYFQVFLLQGLMMLLISSPLVVGISAAPQELTGFELGAVIIWIIGFLFEALGDHQLKKFKIDPHNHGKVLQTGLWKYTRHPNYFGEATMWWAIWLIALPTTWGFFSIIGPLTITWLLVGVSGIPLLEKRYEHDAHYQDYKRRTSAFLPWFPRSR